MKCLLKLLPALFFVITISSCSSNTDVNRSLTTQPHNIPADWERQGAGTALGGALGGRNSFE